MYDTCLGKRLTMVVDALSYRPSKTKTWEPLYRESLRGETRVRVLLSITTRSVAFSVSANV